MNFTSRSRYALKIMMDLAFHAQFPHVHRRDIAKRQGIPQEYMDQILMRLRAGGMVESVRGRGGGYRLAKPATAVSLWELFMAAEGSLGPVQCLDGKCKCEFIFAASVYVFSMPDCALHESDDARQNWQLCFCRRRR